MAHSKPPDDRQRAGSPLKVVGGSKSPRRARTPQEAGKGQPPKKLAITLAIRIEGEEGLNEFARILKILHDHGYPEFVGRLVRELVKAAKEHGAAIPPEIEAQFGPL